MFWRNLDTGSLGFSPMSGVKHTPVLLGGKDTPQWWRPTPAPAPTKNRGDRHVIWSYRPGQNPFFSLSVVVTRSSRGEASIWPDGLWEIPGLKSRHTTFVSSLLSLGQTLRGCRKKQRQNTFSFPSLQVGKLRHREALQRLEAYSLSGHVALSGWGTVRTTGNVLRASGVWCPSGPVLEG